MRHVHEHLMDAILAERTRLVSRRGLMTGGVKLAAGGALALAVLGGPARSGPFLGRVPALAQDEDFADDVDVLNYALTLEHLEYAFYRDGVGRFALGTDGFGNDIATYLGMIRDHEQAHVETLTKVITDLKGTPVEEATYDFGYTDAASFLATAAALENTGVQAYDGAGKYLKSPELLTAAGGIVAVEARHASYLNLITGELPFPDGFEKPATKDEVLAIAGPFIVS
jgi:rubrerythrin